ncbi:DUF4181 domain-containing protein [Kurthia huakuii]|uniref:DUF4181 domain-containing protein n=1 Tax=Kurthia huakuii TaxID=1421019 RepID=UPI000496A260|nr:DUF4181 domain-containing protein [Kurthia huakuii]MBM7698613.1 TRAP-type C4-dicarboxylate transport system permease large subunit [Kurthia huakuii]
MDLLGWILFFILAVLVMVVITKFVTKKFNIPQQPAGKYEHVNVWQKQLERMLYIVFLIVLMIEMFIVQNTRPFSIYVFIVLFVGSRMFFEYRYRQENKQYIIYGVTLAYMLVFFAIIDFIG